ncbi:Rhomboid domain-containing protein [Aphelenchoides besseyi]|nr:Rhomboid domain-containing protein [Aphelenchoides besseyi]
MKRKTIKVHPKEIKKSAARHGEEEWLRTFQIMDYNEDNYVDLIEFESAIRNGADRWRVSVEVAKKLFQHVDRNNDQRVDLNEFYPIIFDFGIAFYGRYFNGPDKISHTAHIGGFVVGLLLGIVLLRNLRLKKWEQVAWWIRLTAYLIFNMSCLIVIYYNKSRVRVEKSLQLSDEDIK